MERSSIPRHQVAAGGYVYVEIKSPKTCDLKEQAIIAFQPARQKAKRPRLRTRTFPPRYLVRSNTAVLCVDFGVKYFSTMPYVVSVSRPTAISLSVRQVVLMDSPSTGADGRMRRRIRMRLRRANSRVVNKATARG
jgi:hypothetical protein